MTVLLHPLDGEIIHCAFIRILKIPDGGTSRSVCRSCWFLQAYPRMALPPGPGKRGSDTWCIPYCTPALSSCVTLAVLYCALYFPLLPGYVFLSSRFSCTYQPGENGQIISFFFYPGKKRRYRRQTVDVLEILRNTMDVLGGPRIGSQVASGANIRSKRWHTIRVVMTFRRWLTPRRHDGTSFSPRLRVVLTFRRWWASGDKVLAGSSALVSLVPSC